MAELLRAVSSVDVAVIVAIREACRIIIRLVKTSKIRRRIGYSRAFENN